jgi:hypothetical protein
MHTRAAAVRLPRSFVAGFVQKIEYKLEIASPNSPGWPFLFAEFVQITMCGTNGTDGVEAAPATTVSWMPYLSLGHSALPRLLIYTHSLALQGGRIPTSPWVISSPT